MTINKKAKFTPSMERLLECIKRGGEPMGLGIDLTVTAVNVISASCEYPHESRLMFSALVGMGLNVNVKTSDGMGAPWGLLVTCIDHDFIDGVKILLDNGVDVAIGHRSWSPLEAAIGRRDLACVRLILECRPLKEALRVKGDFSRDGSQAPDGFFVHTTSRPSGVAGDEAKIVRVLLEAGLPADGLLARACSHFCWDFPDAIDLLMEYGCDIHDPKNPPILLAAGAGKPKMVQRLLELGADPWVKTAKGASIMRCAAKSQEVKEVLRSWKTSQMVSASLEQGVEAAPKPNRKGLSPL